MHIKIVPLNVDHIDYIMEWVNDSEITQYFASMRKKVTREEELEFIKKIIASQNDIVYSVFDSDSGDYIGQVSINQIHWLSGEGRLFMVVVKKHQGKGYGHEILKAIQDAAFINLQLHRLYLIVRPENVRGIQLYHRCGFRQEGYLYDKYKIEDQWIDMIQMAIIRS
ncbi:hypothetical protein A3J19_01670 [Candidatus Daviesbacteria bacterium RIFCSPLOWO2_02_FULL_41_8]|uniref:N-acetyltransferase domain-containing protein n=1 Tax=Candidatus Daviesbacteria bacterium RIFCSPLOWO2_02_FULL_41_8 TaxID=1797798 RepID=A0A1F5NJ54_9BACT|nr:MAG: hypothetical protein A3J19_01670 [Candidatus Daviesbacteria bacterium RIFCSPLOWO2_02_FULL_41_8]OGI16591.1 MAG: hypothetical protein A3J63_01955 [Candidatus Moranbacteria bacterium RIFCSPHIGHO2_02_FULL_40_12b]OGI23392.1 MAG: hypothetical protein A3E91_02460 [Candidatus Moranbacteria bacterium RIFCSPHIGHO2_12_FULL_40_10]